MSTIQDRIRIPWRGGAKQVTPDTLIPVVLVPALLALASADLLIGILVVLLFLLFFNSAAQWFVGNNAKTKFFTAWACMSVVSIVLIFEILVIAMLEILPEENIWLGLSFFVFLGLMHVTRSRAPKLKQAVAGDVEENGAAVGEDFCVVCRKKMQERTHHCHICQVCVPEKDFHFFWYDCCIGQTNNGFFMLSLLFAIISLLYSSNLTLTSVCHPFTFVWTIMLPDDCSEVYEQYDMSLCFVSAVYSIIIALYLLWILLRHCLLVSLGLTGCEWTHLPLRSKMVCGWGTKRLYNDGCFRNWYTLLFYSSKNKSNNAYIET